MVGRERMEERMKSNEERERRYGEWEGGREERGKEFYSYQT